MSVFQQETPRHITFLLFANVKQRWYDHYVFCWKVIYTGNILKKKKRYILEIFNFIKI